MPGPIETIRSGRESAGKFNRNFQRLAEGTVVSSDGSVLITQTPAGTDLRARQQPLVAPQAITALLTEAGDDGAYAWEQERRTPDGWEAVEGGLSGTLDENPAYTLDPADTTDLTGEHAVLVRVPVLNADDEIVSGWVIVGGAVADEGGGDTLPAPGADYTVLMSLSGAWVVDYPRGHA